MADMRERSTREMSFEEEAKLFEEEARAEFAKETGCGDAEGVNNILRRGMRIIRKAREEIARQSLHPKGEWILEAHDERVNFRWHVTAKCSECEVEPKEIWAGFFPCISDEVASFIALKSAESVKLDNFCPNRGADMRGEKDERKAD